LKNIIVLVLLVFSRSGGREAEGGGLLNRYTGQTRIGGSNPLHSAINFTQAIEK
jgi:hypothetical protein